MKKFKILLYALIVCFILAPHVLSEQENPDTALSESFFSQKLQAGIFGGYALGISGRWWLSDRRAVISHLGIEYVRVFQISHVWKFTYFPEDLRDLHDYFDSYYIGIGGTAKISKGEWVGVRFPMALCRDFEFLKLPLFVAAEFAPIYRLSPSFGFNFDALLSFEYRF